VFDFRYHALSLVAVFLALGIGIVLGVTIGDSLVSDAEKNIRKSLRGDVVDARNDADQARADLRRRDDLISGSLPLIAGSRLRGRSVAVVGIGALPRDAESSIRDAVELARGKVDSASTLRVPDDLDKLGKAAHERTSSPRLVRRLGRKLGRGIVRGGRIPVRLDDELPQRFGGDFRGADEVALYRSPPKKASGRKAKREADEREAFEEGLLRGLRDAGARVVGVEQAGTDPSQVGWFKEQDLSSVDNVDLAGGRAALILVLEGADGAYGFKKSADRALPRT
jgi:hypothetical protein